MFANPALGLVAGLSIAESKGLTGSDATKVAMLAAIADFPMGIVLASVIAGREADAAAAAAANAGSTVSTGTGATPTPPPAPTPTGTGTTPQPAPTPTPAPGKPPRQDPAVLLGNEFAKLQTAAAQLALHESEVTIDTRLERLVAEIREAREQVEEQNRAALHRDREARKELGESEATEKREEAAERQRKTGKPAASRGS